MPSDDQIVLRMDHIVKRFSRVLANDDISIELRRQEILALLGENGAGKSTLMNILYGLYSQTSGDIVLGGEEVRFHSPKDAIRHGLGMVHQHFMLIEDFTVAENIVLGVEPGRLGIIDFAEARRTVRDLSERYRLNIDPDRLVESLPVGLQQRVEILKALYRKARILILDEPTSVLTPQEADELFAVVRGLRAAGVSIIIITHKLDEVKSVSDRVYILRRGKLVGERVTAEATIEELANQMVGRNVVLTVHKEARSVEAIPLIEIEHLTVLREKGLQAIRDLSLNVRPGEIVGIAGVDGNGQTELAEAIMGLRPAHTGAIRFRGRDVRRLDTKNRRRMGFAHVPADRQRQGLVLSMKVSENLVIGFHDRPQYSGLINLKQKRIDEHSKELVHLFDIRTPSIDVSVDTLSGGNQQKLVLARELSREPEFLLVSQPTRGLDVGAIEYVHTQILEMRRRQVAILLISLELEEIFALSDRILVLFEGRIVKELIPEETSEEEVGLFMAGGSQGVRSA